jgi:hypothetical protein
MKRIVSIKLGRKENMQPRQVWVEDFLNHSAMRVALLSPQRAEEGPGLPHGKGVIDV